ncbi:hypothetical protein MNB_SV-5-1141 [hydrothermal vent metagenome]|uniref:Uncharacterized protein n=1 Tax=hydrothermal vent metagenome TaxID=652676 RepID=A0A1W1ECB3_9ZZZZ
MNTILPCFEHYSLLEVEEKLSLDNMQTLLGKSEKIVLNFPKFNKTIEELNIYNLRDIPFIKDKIIKLNSKLENDFNYGLSDFYTDKISEWSQTKDNIFLICSLEDSFLGYLFALRLKPKIFTKLVNLEMKESEIKQEHFASLEEMGSDYFLSFFAMNKEAAALLFIKYYAQLVINQKSIHEVGGATMLEDAKKLIEKMCLQRHKAKPITLDDGEEIMLQTYKESLANFIACESVLKLIFQYDKK